MKSFFFWLLGLIMFAQQTVAQSNQDSMPAKPVTPAPPVAQAQPATPVATTRPISYSGGFGHFFTGPAWIQPQDLVDHLQSPEVFGSSFDWDNLAIITGAEGMAEIHNLLVGGGGFGLLVQNMDADSGTVRFAFGGGYAKVGYVLMQNPRYFLSFTAGFGGGAMYVGIENLSEETPVYFSSKEPVYAGGDKDYFRGYLLYDLAINNKLIATYISPNARKFGGLMLGLDLGATIGIPVDTWRDDFGAVSGIPSPGTVMSPYLRLTIGGGGFRKHMPVQ